MGFWVAVFFAIIIITLATLVYFQLPKIMPDADVLATIDWGDFGNYMSGIAGPLLLLIVLLMMLSLIRKQAHHFNKLFDESKQLEMLRHLGKIDDDITRLLCHELVVGDRQIQLGDFVDGLTDPTTHLRDNPSYRAAMDRLLKLTSTYCEAIGTYRNDLASRFAFDIHLQRARELHSYLERNRDSLNPMVKQALSYCKMHLDGKKVTPQKKPTT